MQKNFVTLFNSNYLSRGITMYRSLLSTTKDFHLYIIAFDDLTYNYLIEENFPQITAISLKEFEDPELLKIKPTRTAAEYCWTCTPSTVNYCIQTFKLDHCVYIDADMFFYSDPKILFDEWGNRSILITKHRFSNAYVESAHNGIYCVQFVGFKNDDEGMKALKWWRTACLEWCYDRLEDGKFGDQKYLDDWNTRFKNVCDLEYLGGGVAPWNVQQYEFVNEDGKWKGKELGTGKRFDLVFFHFHSLKFYTNETISLASHYDLSNRGVIVLYFNYVKELLKTAKQLSKKLENVNVNGATGVSPSQPYSELNDVKNKLKGILGRGQEFSDAQKNIFYLKEVIAG